MSEEARIAFEPFTEEHRAFRRTVREYCERELAPHARAWDEAAEFPRSLFRTFGDMGFFGIRRDPAYGGSGLDYWYVVAYAEELVRSRSAGLAMSMLVHGEMDDNVPPYNTQLVVDALVKAGKDFDLLMFPHARHGFGPDAPYMMRRRWDYFVQHLMGAQPPKEYQIGRPVVP